jgi:hypothetical protein
MTEAVPCSSPLSWETLVAYWAHDPPADEEEAAELHLLGSATCTAESRRVAAVTEGLRAGPPALEMIEGERRDTAPRPRRRWLLATSAAGAVMALAAGVTPLLVPRGAKPWSVELPPPVRDAAAMTLSPPPGARDVRLLPVLGAAVTANGARVRRLDGAWLAVRVEAGPPFAVVLRRADLSPGRYELEAVSVGPGDREESRGFYRFVVTPP